MGFAGLKVFNGAAIASSPLIEPVANKQVTVRLVVSRRYRYSLALYKKYATYAVGMGGTDNFRDRFDRAKVNDATSLSSWLS